MRNLQVYMLSGITPRARISPWGMQVFTVTTAQLRRALHDPNTPRAAKCAIYPMLLHRRRRP